MMMLPGRLRGSAFLAFGGEISNYNSAELFLEALTNKFGGSEDIDTIRMELYHAKQGEDENITDYSDRILDIQHRYLAAFDAANPDVPLDDPRKQKIISDVVESFLGGLTSPAEYKIAVKNPRTLEEASNYALQIEKKQQFAKNHKNPSFIPTITKSKKTKNPV